MQARRKDFWELKLYHFRIKRQYGEIHIQLVPLSDHPRSMKLIDEPRQFAVWMSCSLHD